MADRHDEHGTRDLTRRAFLGGTAAAAATAILAACGSSSTATNTPAPTTAPAAAASPAAGAASPAAAATTIPTTGPTRAAAATTGTSPTTVPATTGGASPAPTTAAAAGTPKKGGILKVGLQADPVALDPHKTSLTATSHILEHIYGRLVMIDATLSPKPDLAESWTASSDGLVYTFKLRQGVKFHNGQPFVAGDVKYSYERVLDPATKSAQKSALTGIDKIEVPDDYTVKFTLKTPNAAFVVGLFPPNYAIVKKEDVDKNGDLTKTANGTGPFMFKDYTPNTKVTLVKNPNYWDTGKPYLDGIEMVPVPDDTARSTAIRTGTVDFVEYAPAKDIPLLKADKTLTITGDQNTNIRYLGFNLDLKSGHANPAFQNPKVRQAISMAMDRQAIVDAAFYGLAIPTLTVFPPGYWATLDTKVPPQDIAGAKKMLADAGVTGGIKTAIKTWSSYPFLSNAALAVQDQLKQIGITADVLPEDNGTFIADNNAHNYELIVSGTSGYTDPNEIMLPNFGTGQPSNNTGYSNPAFDKLVADGVAASTQDDRKKVYAQVQQILLTDNPWVMLYVGSQYEAMKSYVKGYVHNATGSNGTPGFAATWLDK
ncbi:MAG: ABC transporter substrate-binding protein [Thermomicrobiales bacterium]